MTRLTDAEKQMTGTPALCMMGDALANLNHDIRTSMNGVAGMLLLLLDSNLTPAQRQAAANAQHCAENLIGLIENIVDFSMLESGRIELASTSFDLLSVLQAACAAPSTAARSKGLALRTQFPPTMPLQGDALRLQQLVSGLISSAVSLTTQGQLTVDMQAAHNEADGRCAVRVTVTAPEFDLPGHQLVGILNQEGSTDTAALTHGATGLQLALCKRLTRLMGAQFGADNRAGGPACLWFAVELPLSFEQCGSGIGCMTGSCAGEQHGKQALSLAGYRILVVDDNPINQQVAQRLLEKFGCRAEVAADGQQAIAMHAARPYDLILMDCQMPQLDGFQSTERIRALDGDARRTPVVALTACAAQDAREHCLARGMDDFVSKPVRPQMLEAVLARWLAQAPPDAIADSGRGDELDVVRDMFGTDFAELAMLYQNDSPPRIAALHRAGAAGDHLQLAKVAHAFGGSCVSIGATGLAALCKELEMSAKANSLDDYPKRLAAIETEYGRISSKLQAMCQAFMETK